MLMVIVPHISCSLPQQVPLPRLGPVPGVHQWLCGICFWVMGLPGGVFTHWVKIFGAPVISLQTFAIEGTVSLKCPMPLVGPMPLALVLQFLPLLHSPGSDGSMVSMDLEGVIHNKCEGSTGSNTLASVKVLNGSIHSLNSLMHSASWHDLPVRVGLARLAQCCRALAYASLLRLFQMIVL